MLTAIFRHATTVPLAALAAGMLLPGVAHYAREVIGFAVLVSVFSSTVARRMAPPDRADRLVIAAFVLGASVIGPVAGWLLASAMVLPPEEIAWFVLATAAPIAVASGAIGRSMGLPDRAATLAGLATMLLSPLSVPLALAATVGRDALGFDPLHLARNLALFVVVPAILAMVLRRLRPGFATRNAQQFSGLAILALAVLAFARGEALTPALLHDTWNFLRAVGLAMMAGLLSGSVAALAACRFGRREATEGAVAGALRNVPLVWGALSGRLPPAGELFLAATVVPFYLLPWVAKWILRTTPANAPAVPAVQPGKA